MLEVECEVGGAAGGPQNEGAAAATASARRLGASRTARRVSATYRGVGREGRRRGNGRRGAVLAWQCGMGGGEGKCVAGWPRGAARSAVA